jgi:sugar lactone lactonase YvrE
VLEGVTISNGLAWSPDGRTFFYIDTPTRRIDAFDVDPSTGAIARRRTAVEVPASAGWPDGMTVDAEGGLWVALWGGWAIHRYLDGRLDRVIEMPVAQPTSCAFGGQELDELFITSAWKGLSDAERAAQPVAGALFRLRPGVRGVPPVPFAG